MNSTVCPKLPPLNPYSGRTSWENGNLWLKRACIEIKVMGCIFSMCTRNKKTPTIIGPGVEEPFAGTTPYRAHEEL